MEAERSRSERSVVTPVTTNVSLLTPVRTNAVVRSARTREASHPSPWEWQRYGVFKTVPASSRHMAGTLQTRKHAVFAQDHHHIINPGTVP